MATNNLTSILPLLESIGPYNEVPDEYDATDSINALKASKILVIGAGGLGCEILKNLVLTGFRNLDIMDMDTIDVSNLNRQFLFRRGDVGRSKAEVAAEFVRSRMEDEELNITPYFGKIQDKDIEFYKHFDLVICGLDSVEARRWINATLVSLVDDQMNNLIPLIDGGTEGFRGQSRVILPTLTSCYECTLDLISPKVTYPVCTIANTPRLPEHCIEWASMLQWPRLFPEMGFDADNPEHLETMYRIALERAEDFRIPGVTKRLTLGVVKNIIPAIASTNAIIAASCCNEAFKIITNSNPPLDNYMMYSGDDSIFTYTYSQSKKLNCPVCGNVAKNMSAQNWWTLNDLIMELETRADIQLKSPSLATASSNLYLRQPPSLEEATRHNLHKKLKSIVGNEDEIVVTDPSLPISMRLNLHFSGPNVCPF